MSPVSGQPGNDREHVEHEGVAACPGGKTRAGTYASEPRKRTATCNVLIDGGVSYSIILYHTVIVLPWNDCMRLQHKNVADLVPCKCTVRNRCCSSVRTPHPVECGRTRSLLHQCSSTWALTPHNSLTSNSFKFTPLRTRGGPRCQPPFHPRRPPHVIVQTTTLPSFASRRRWHRIDALQRSHRTAAVRRVLHRVPPTVPIMMRHWRDHVIQHPGVVV